MTLELPQTDSCYFCDILAATEEHYLVWAEDELTLTMLNGRQFEAGQSIVVPKRHMPTIFELGDREAAAIMTAAKRAAQNMMAVFEPTGILLYQNNGVGSGQEVPHFHLHVVPRQAGSDWGLGPPHLAEMKRRANAKFDHTISTAEKRETARLLRMHHSKCHHEE